MKGEAGWQGKGLKRICAAARDRPVYIKAGIAAVVSVLCCAGLYMWDNSHAALERMRPDRR